jgi:site-specific DNA recombinase
VRTCRDTETWPAVRDQLATNARDHRQKAAAAEPSLLVGVLVDARGERLTPAHAAKKDRRYRYYVSAALITEAGTDRAQSWRLPAQEIEDVVIRVLTDALTSPARLLERFGTAIPSDQTRQMFDRATRLAKALRRSPRNEPRSFDLAEKVIIEQQAITIRIRRGSLSGRAVVPPSSENPIAGPIELTAPVAFKRRGIEMRLVLPGTNDRSKCDPIIVVDAVTVGGMITLADAEEAPKRHNCVSDSGRKSCRP